MAEIHIERDHGMDLAQARQTAQHWATQAQQKYQLQGAYAEGPDADTFSFERAGVTGTLQVTGQAFTLDARLGFLMSAFAPQIEAEMVKKIDALVAKNANGPSASA